MNPWPTVPKTVTWYLRARALHLVAEAVDVRERCVGIVGTAVRDDVSGNRAGLGGRVGGQDPVVAHRGPEVGAAARQLEHRRAAVAEPDRGDPGCVDVRSARDLVEPGDRPSALPIGIGLVLTEREAGVLHRRALEVGAVHIGADGQVALVGELPRRGLVHPVGDSERAVHHEYRRHRPGGVGARRVPAQLCPVVLELDGLHPFEHCATLHEATRARSTSGSSGGVSHPWSRVATAGPGPATWQALTVEELPKTRYASNGDVHLAYQELGEGPLDIVVVESWVHHVEAFWAVPEVARQRRRLASIGRVVILDRRGTGLSDPVTPRPPARPRDPGGRRRAR